MVPIARAVVGALLREPERIRTIDPELCTEDIVDPEARACWSAMLDCREDGLPIEHATIASKLIRRGMSMADAAAVPGQLWHDACSSAALPVNVATLRAESAMRAAMLAGEDIDAGDGRPRWAVPVLDLIGGAEPDDDDSADWIIRDVVPRGEGALIAGAYKTGKSYLMLDLALVIALGLPWLGGAAANTLGRPARVMVLALEDSLRRLSTRLWRLARGHGTTPNDPRIRDNLMMSRAPVRIPDRADVRAFRRELAAAKPAVVFIDCLARVMVGDESDAAAAKEYVAAVQSICVELGIGVVVLHHTRKGQGEDRRYRPITLDDVRGSGDLVAAARHVVLWQRLPIADRKVSRLGAGGNLDIRTAERAVELVAEESGGRTIERLIDRGDAGEFLAAQRADKGAAKVAMKDAGRARLELAALRIAALRGHVSAAAVAAATQAHEKTCGRTLATLVERGHLSREGRTAPATITEAGRAVLETTTVEHGGTGGSDE